jgi:Aldo/keto reductase family
MSLNSFITLGRSGLRVSPFCLGSMTFGEDLGWGASVADSETMIAAYLERGSNFIDTANIYTNGHSEKISGDFFARGKANRDRVVIGTKFFCSLFEGDPNGGGAGRKALIQQCEASLRRLWLVPERSIAAAVSGRRRHAPPGRTGASRGRSGRTVRSRIAVSREYLNAHGNRVIHPVL